MKDPVKHMMVNDFDDWGWHRNFDTKLPPAMDLCTVDAKTATVPVKGREYAGEVTCPKCLQRMLLEQGAP